jgi:RNA polymerase sigma-70 factor (TIGR02943 family)
MQDQHHRPTTGEKNALDAPRSRIGPESWLDSHGDCLYRYALLRVRAPELAAELVQETFLEALRGWGSFAGRSSERTWLVGILRHRIVDHLRRTARERTASGESSSGPIDDSAFDARGHWRATPDSWRDDPVSVLETREFWDVFGVCLSRLPRSLADAFFLREIDGLSADETRELLKISTNSLWTRLHRARSLLRDCLQLNWFAEHSPPTRKPK